jgi:hypothetical protein
MYWEVGILFILRPAKMTYKYINNLKLDKTSRGCEFCVNLWNN